MKRTINESLVAVRESYTLVNISMNTKTEMEPV